MKLKARSIDSQLQALEAFLSTTIPGVGAVPRPIGSALARLRTDLSAVRFQLLRNDATAHTTLVAVVGGTGTGKSTLVNRLLGAEAKPITAASFRRTYTAGPVAVVHQDERVPERWLGIDHDQIDATSLPARGRSDALTLVPLSHDLLRHATIIDTPDLDGDQPAHHAQADRLFRWADTVVFLVTPEKYQMTELLPYYRLAKRYAIPSLFVMNKVEDEAAVEDYARLLARSGSKRSPRDPSQPRARPWYLPSRATTHRMSHRQRETSTRCATRLRISTLQMMTSGPRVLFIGFPTCWIGFATRSSTRFAPIDARSTGSSGPSGRWSPPPPMSM
jgi:hypothetical protein